MAARSVLIVDVGLSNSKSVANAFHFLGCDVTVSSKTGDIGTADKIVLPGVGAFNEGIRRLRRAGFDKALERAIKDEGRKVLGICLGMQLLCDLGSEGGPMDGLGVIQASVVPLERQSDPALRIPHVGYNSVRLNPQSQIFRGLGQEVDFYFAHSFHCNMRSTQGHVSKSSYGQDFVAAYEYENVFGTQFHPEKSSRNGLRVLRNFVEA